MPRTLSITVDHFGLKTPFRISRGAKTAAEVVTVRLEQDQVLGRGEGVPYARYGESPAASVAAIEAVRDAVENGASRADLLTLMPAGAARNAVDAAMWDLEAGRQGRSVAQIIGGREPDALVTALTISLDTPEAMARAAASLTKAAVLKIKVDRDDPLARLRAIRAQAPAAAFIVDPNESWTIDDLERWSPALLDLGVILLEQPLPADDDDGLLGFASPVPIAADESAHGIETLDRVAARYQVVNIKLDKTGGLTAALDLVHAARARGLGIMTGCMVCSSLSIAPAAHIAVQSDFVDLDGAVGLVADRVDGIEVDDRGAMSFGTVPTFWGGR